MKGQISRAYIAQGFLDRGIDAVEISGWPPILPDILSKEDFNYFARASRNIVRSVDVPIINVGGYRDDGSVP